MTKYGELSRIAAAAAAVLLVALQGCGADDGGGAERGTLVVQYQIGEQKAVHTCDILNNRQTLYSMAVSSGEVVEGAQDDLQWYTVYEGDGEPTLTTEKVFSAELPVGTYENYRIDQGNRVEWICSCDGTEITLPSLNVDDLPPDAHAPMSVVNQDGCWGYDESGLFYLMAAGETAGGFEIRADGTTTVTIVVNMAALDWDDADDSGDWSEGDSLDNWATAPGTTTMFDFIVTYE